MSYTELSIDERVFIQIEQYRSFSQREIARHLGAVLASAASCEEIPFPPEAMRRAKSSPLLTNVEKSVSGVGLEQKLRVTMSYKYIF